MDYYGFQPELYQLQFKSRGDPELAQRIVQLYKNVRSVPQCLDEHELKWLTNSLP